MMAVRVVAPTEMAAICRIRCAGDMVLGRFDIEVVLHVSLKPR